jgi:DNA-binding winged helix-turn-helix (wHTH) protein/tetratricopeptide (TPR) repeat protein/TolB-like protein
MKSVVASGNIFRFGLFEVDAARNALTRGGMRVKIQDQPFRVLMLLLGRPGEIITREELRQKLWPEGTYVDFDGSLNVVLKKLRAAIDDDSDNPRFVETVPRRGYRFIAPVSATATEPPIVPVVSSPTVERKPVVSASAVQALDIASAQDSAPAHRKPLPLYLYAFGAALVILVAAAWLLWHWKSASPRITSASASAPVVPVRKSAAILGFHNVSGRAEETWLGTALSEMLSTELAAGDTLRLVSGEDVANLRQSSPWSQSGTLDQKTTSRIGTALNSDLVVLGSYTLIGGANRGRLRLDIRMQDAKTGEILSEIAEVGRAQDLFPMVGRVGDKLRDRLDIPTLERSDEATVRASLPPDRDAARFYARGLAKLREFDALAAKDLFEQAIKTDPKFALVHLMLGRAWAQLGYEQKRKEEAKKALDLSSNLPAAARLEVQGEYYESLADHEKAASTFGALFQMFPDSVEYGLLLASAQNAAGHSSQAAYTISQLRALPAPASDDPRIDLADVSAQNDPARLALIRSALRKASAQGKKMIYAQARKAECLNLIYGEHPEQGPPACQDAYNIYMAMGNRLGAADAMRLLGDYEGAQGHLEQAVATYQKALTILEELGEHSKTGAVLNNMAINFTNAGKLDRGEQLYRQAKSHFEQAGDKANVALTIANIADIYFLRGDLPGAGRLYQQALDIQSRLDHGDTNYLLLRLADLELTEGHIQDAHRMAQQAVDGYRAKQGGYGYLAEALIELGEVLRAEGDFDGARQQFESARDLSQKLGSDLLPESQAELADLALEEGQGNQAESLLRPAIARFEEEKSDPAASGAYTDLSRALLMEGRADEAHKAVQRAIELSMTSSDPGLKLPAAIQNARVEMAGAGQEGNSTFSAVRMQLNAVIGTAKKLGYYDLECDARLALGTLEARVNPASARMQLTALALETRSHGLELLARQAERAIATPGTSIAAANRPVR